MARLTGFAPVLTLRQSVVLLLHYSPDFNKMVNTVGVAPTLPSCASCCWATRPQNWLPQNDLNVHCLSQSQVSWPLDDGAENGDRWQTGGYLVGLACNPSVVTTPTKWYPRWDSNPQLLVLKTSACFRWATGAYL